MPSLPARTIAAKSEIRKQEGRVSKKPSPPEKSWTRKAPLSYEPRDYTCFRAGGDGWKPLGPRLGDKGTTAASINFNFRTNEERGPPVPPSAGHDTPRTPCKTARRLSLRGWQQISGRSSSDTDACPSLDARQGLIVFIS